MSKSFITLLIVLFACSVEMKACKLELFDDNDSISMLMRSSESWTITPINGNSTNAPYDFYLKRDYYIRNTFHIRKYYSQGAVISINITNSTKPNVIFCFKENNPENCSYKSIGNTYNSLSFVAPSNGYYKILIISLSQNGRCNVNINNINYLNVPINFNYIECEQDTTQIYNTFTWNSTDNLSICVLDNNGKVCAFNEDYFSSGNFNWGHEARIKKHFSNLASSIIVFPSDIYADSVKTDLYARCKYPEYYANYFYNWNVDDAITTVPSTNYMSEIYNCFAWAGGCWFAWIDPTCFPEIEYNPSEGGYLVLDYWLRDCGYTTDGATESNSEIDLYRLNTVPEYPKIISHMAIRSYTNNLSYGYSWESKLGAQDRVMHPRYALTGNYSANSPDNKNHGYGTVVMHYILDAGGPSYSFLFQNVDFTEEEMDTIRNNIRGIPKEDILIFETLLNKCNEDFTSNLYSNTEMLLTNVDYLELLSFCKNNPKLLFLVFKKISEGDIVSCRLISDATLEDNKDILEKIRLKNLNNSNDGSKIIRSLQSQATAYVKCLLYKYKHFNVNTYNMTNTSLSNDDSFLVVSSNNGIISVSFTLDKEYKVTLMIANQFGEIQSIPIQKQKMKKGYYENNISTIKGKGTFVVTLLCDNKIYSKKIFIK